MTSHPAEPPTPERDAPERDVVQRWDVVVIGAGLAGSSLAALLLRRSPATRVLVVDERESLPSTSLADLLSPLGSLFFGRVLGAEELLVRGHLSATGCHLWFSSHERNEPGDLHELRWDLDGPQAAHHVDLAKLATGLRRRARVEGLQLLLGTRVEQVELQWPESRLTLADGRGRRELRARWVVDAGGPGARLARELGLQRNLGSVATWSATANWSGLRELDLPLPPGSRSRLFATHRFCGDQWQVRQSPHPAGGSSVELLTRTDAQAARVGGRSLEGYSRFVRARPGLRESLRSARLDPDSFAARTQNDWTVVRRCARGWWLVGEAAGVLRSGFASPLERLVRDVWPAAETILGDVTGANSEQRTSEELELHEAHCRVRDASEASELFSATGELGVDPELCAALLRVRRVREQRELRQVLRSASPLASSSRQILWLRSLQDAWVGRLRALAAARRVAGITGHKHPGRARRIDRGGTHGAVLALAAMGWIGLEYGVLREALRPVPNDVRTAPHLELSRRAALARERLAAFERGPGPVGDRGIDLQ